MTTQAEEPPACLNGCLTASLIVVFIGICFGTLVVAVVLGAACLGAASAYEPDDVFIRGMVEMGVLPEDFEYVPLTPDPTAAATAAPVTREIEVDLTHHQTQAYIDYTRICLAANFLIPPSHLVMGVSGGGKRSAAIDNDGYVGNSNRDNRCENGWSHLGATTEGPNLVSFDLASATIDRLRTFDSETLVATLWDCERQEDFLRDALFGCAEEASWKVSELEPESALLLVNFRLDAQQTFVKSRVGGLSGVVHNLTWDDHLNQYYRIFFRDLPKDQWLNAGGFYVPDTRNPVVGVVGIDERWTGLYCLPESEELVLCDVWSEPETVTSKQQ